MEKMNTMIDSKIVGPYAYFCENTDVERHSKKDFTTIRNFIGKRPLTGYFKGIRPILRIFLERKCLLELRKV